MVSFTCKIYCFWKISSEIKFGDRISLQSLKPPNRRAFFFLVGGNSARGFVGVIVHSPAGTKSVYIYGWMDGSFAGAPCSFPGASCLSSVDTEKKNVSCSALAFHDNHDDVLFHGMYCASIVCYFWFNFFFLVFAIPSPVIVRFLPPRVAGGNFGVDVNVAVKDTRSCVVFFVPVQVGVDV